MNYIEGPIPAAEVFDESDGDAGLADARFSGQQQGIRRRFETPLQLEIV
jgi:hypothetical protein